MLDLDALMTRLGSVPHFKGLSASDLQAIVSAGKLIRCPAESYLFMEDEPCAGMFVLLSGQIHLCKLGPQGKQNIMAVIKPVIMFNEVAVLDGGANPATALAAQECLVWRISHEAFHSLLERYPQLGLSLLRVLAVRNRILIESYYDLSFRSVLSRTAKLLLELSQNGDQPIIRREHPIHTLAARTATVPEAVSRSLKELREQGLIDVSRTVISVMDTQALADQAQLDR